MNDRPHQHRPREPRKHQRQHHAHRHCDANRKETVLRVLVALRAVVQLQLLQREHRLFISVVERWQLVRLQLLERCLVARLERGHRRFDAFVQEDVALVLHVLDEALLFVTRTGAAEIVSKAVVRDLQILVEALQDRRGAILIVQVGERGEGSQRETQSQQLAGAPLEIGNRWRIYRIHLLQRVVTGAQRQQTRGRPDQQYDAEEGDHQGQAGAD